MDSSNSAGANKSLGSSSNRYTGGLDAQVQPIGSSGATSQTFGSTAACELDVCDIGALSAVSLLGLVLS